MIFFIHLFFSGKLKVNIYRSYFKTYSVIETPKLTNNIQKGEGDQQICSPVEAVCECECSSFNSSWKYFTQEEPCH